MMTGKPTTTDKKRKRLTLEEQIAREKEKKAKIQDELAKKQKRLRSLNASKMNKDRIQARKKRNSMLIQLGLFFIERLNKSARSEYEDYIDITEEIIQ